MILNKLATRIVGLDFGLARIGISLSDERKIIASPLSVFKCEDSSEKTAKKLIDFLHKHAQDNKYAVEEIVIGMPLMMSGKMGFLADEVKHFVELLKNSLTIPIITWDERLTTVQAEKSLRESEMTRKKRAQVVDTVAAVIILQNYLDHRHLMQQQRDEQQ